MEEPITGRITSIEDTGFNIKVTVEISIPAEFPPSMMMRRRAEEGSECAMKRIEEYNKQNAKDKLLLGRIMNLHLGEVQITQLQEEI